MRVLMVAACPLPWPRGTPIRVHRMAEALLEAGHDVTVTTYPLGDMATLVPYRMVRVAQGSHMASRPGPSLKKIFYFDPLLGREVARALRRERFDVLHAHHYEGLLTALAGRAAAGSRVPLVFDAHTLLGSELPQYPLGMPARSLAIAGAAIDRRLPRYADHVIAVTERMRAWFAAHARLGADRLSLIPNGVEHGFIGSGDNGSPADASHTGSATRRIVFAGNLAEYQGIDLLLEAFAHLRESCGDVELTFITGSDRGVLQPSLHRLGLQTSVRVLCDDYARLPARLAAADVVVNPRVDCDGLPQKLLNYMAAGRPIVSFAGSAALLVHEQTGLIVPDYDTDAFAAAMLRLLNDAPLGRALGAAARSTVVAAFGWEQVAARVTAVYESLRRATP